MKHKNQCEVKKIISHWKSEAEYHNNSQKCKQARFNEPLPFFADNNSQQTLHY